MNTTSNDECRAVILPKCEYGSSKKKHVLVILFPDPENHSDNDLNDLREKIEKSFVNIGYELLKWNGCELKKATRGMFLEDVAKVAKELPPSESFAMIVISSQKNGKIKMTTEDEFEMEDVYLTFDAKTCEKLKCKPKLFVFDTYPYEVQHQDSHQSASIPLSIPEIPEFSGKVPLEADMLVVYSTEGNREVHAATTMVKPKPSFMLTLIEVLENDFRKEKGHKDILELMVDVSAKVLQENGEDSPIPMVLSTLNSQYFLKDDVE